MSVCKLVPPNEPEAIEAGAQTVPGEVTALLLAWAGGDEAALHELMPRV